MTAAAGGSGDTASGASDATGSDCCANAGVTIEMTTAITLNQGFFKRTLLFFPRVVL
jgi:hypothetical protein